MGKNLPVWSIGAALVKKWDWTVNISLLLIFSSRLKLHLAFSPGSHWCFKQKQRGECPGIQHIFFYPGTELTGRWGSQWTLLAVCLMASCFPILSCMLGTTHHICLLGLSSCLPGMLYSIQHIIKMDSKRDCRHGEVWQSRGHFCPFSFFKVLNSFHSIKTFDLL